jgi:ADP-heptose:LPS heptosyltransferase
VGCARQVPHAEAGGAVDVQLVEGVEKLAVLRANAIGDYVVSLPALQALRAAYPAAELVLLGAPWHARFLAGRPGPVDRCLTVPALAGVRDDRPPAPAADVEAFVARARAERFDLAVQLHGGGRHSNPFLRRLGARVTAGSRTPDAAALDRTVPYTPHQHEILRFLEVAGLVGAAPVTLEPRLEVTDADRAEAAAALPGDDDRPLVVLHPGANDPRRRWPVERLAAVAEELARKGARLAVVGTAAERPLAERLLAALDGDAADLAGRLGLGGLVGLLDGAALLVGNDSGPRHLAAAVGAATVAVYWGVHLGSYGPLLRARHRAVTSWRLHCPVCGADGLTVDCRPRHQASFVADVPVDEVLAEALDLLAAEAAGPGQSRGSRPPQARSPRTVQTVAPTSPVTMPRNGSRM